MNISTKENTNIMAQLIKTNVIVAVYHKNLDEQDIFYISYDDEGICDLKSFHNMNEFDVKRVAEAFVTIDKVLRMSKTEFTKKFPRVAKKVF